MSRLMCCVLVGAVSALASVVEAAPSARLFVREVIVPDEYPQVPLEQLVVNKNGGTNFAHPIAPVYTGNSRGYVNATNGRLGARAIAARDPSHGAVAGGTPIPSWAYDRREVTVDVSYRDSLTVTSGTLPANSPIQLGLTLRLDGSIYSGSLKADPHVTHTTGSMGAHFSIIDNNMAGPEGVIPHVDFDAQASSDKFTTRSGDNGIYSYRERANWSLSTPDSYQSTVISDIDSDRPYPFNPAQGIRGVVGAPTDRLDFDTGLLNLVINTYVGARLDISSSIVLTGYSQDNSPTVILDFMNTLSSDLTVLGGEDVTLVKGSAGWSTEIIPEPANLGMLAMIFPLLGRNRRKTR